MTIINVHAAKTHLSRVLDQASAGEEIVIAKAGKPVARLVAYERLNTKPRISGSMEGEIWIADDFDELPPEIAATFRVKSE